MITKAFSRIARCAAPLLLVVLFGLPSWAGAQGGPPMLTDDPGTPGDGRWEVNVFSAMRRTPEGWIFDVPRVDMNYGFGDHIQLKFEAPWLVMKNAGERAKTGPGNSVVGIKWRFLEESRGFDLSIYPQLEFNNHTRSVARGLVDEGAQLFLPIEAAKKIGPVNLTGEVGYRMVQHAPDELEFGVLFARQVTRQLELMGELHGSVLATLREDELFLNAGSRIRIAKHAVLLISAGRTIHGSGSDGPRYIASFGIQINFRNRTLTALRNR